MSPGDCVPGRTCILMVLSSGEKEAWLGALRSGLERLDKLLRPGLRSVIEPGGTA